MTAEIAIMNKEAIALAADSAVTMMQEKGQKIKTSANKLFALSKYCPIGIMIYGSASFMGIPWETIIKIYRNKLGKHNFATFKQYVDDFVSFLNKGNPLFPEAQQKKYLYRITSGYFNNQIKNDINRKVKLIIRQKGKITDSEIEQIVSNVVEYHYNLWENAKALPSIPKTSIKKIIDKYGDIIDEARKDVFEKLPISGVSLKQLKKISASLVSKDIFPNEISGVVIAGFGEKDTFPSLRSFDVEGIVNNKLKYKYKENEFGEINFENNATIIAFAQREMVAVFMEGIDPSLHNQMEGYLSEIFNKYPEIIAENIEKYNLNEKQQLKKKLKEESNKIFRRYQKDITDYRKKNYVGPVIKVVGMLPKDELAAMAESLVSLTSFKRKVTMAAETVGGPIDVAVISKGDGFVWIKKKHYFKAESNPQFFSNYYRR
jgi:hypothetical protein